MSQISDIEDKHSLTDFETEDDFIPSKRVCYDVNQEILHKINKLETNQQNLMILISRLTEEVLLTRLELEKQNGKEVVSDNKEILPQKPFTTVEEFLKFDELIKEENNSKILIANILRRISANCSKDFVFKCWRSLMMDSLAKEFNWSGLNNKISVAKLASTTALQEAFLRKYNDELDIYYKKTKHFFTYANDRFSKREKYNYFKTEN